MTAILGISAYYHDSAAALVRDGEILAAAQQERFSRKKHDARFPAEAVEYCMREAGTGLAGVDYVVFYDKPLIKFERLLETYLAYAPKGFRSFVAAMPVWLKEKLFLKITLRRELARLAGIKEPALPPLLFSAHHESHAASAFYPSPFERAAVLCMDGVGEWATTSVWIGESNRLTPQWEIHFPHSLGLLYSAFTYYTGFKVNSGEYKLMGLAPYGEPKYVETILENLIDLKRDGTFRLNMHYFNYATGLTMTNSAFDRLFGGPPRKPESPLTQREMDGSQVTFSPKPRLSSNDSKYPAVRAGYAILGDAARRITALACRYDIAVVFTIVPTKERVYAERVSTRAGITYGWWSRSTATSPNYQRRFGIFTGRHTWMWLPHCRQQRFHERWLYPRTMNGHPLSAGYRVIADAVAPRREEIIAATAMGALCA